MASKRPEPGSPPKGGKADPEQFQRFLETARVLGCEENFHLLDEALKRAARVPLKAGEPASQAAQERGRKGQSRRQDRA